jgi:hypothetical protein
LANKQESEKGGRKKKKKKSWPKLPPGDLRPLPSLEAIAETNGTHALQKLYVHVNAMSKLSFSFFFLLFVVLVYLLSTSGLSLSSE